VEVGAVESDVLLVSTVGVSFLVGVCLTPPPPWLLLLLLPVVWPLAAALAARCCSCKARRSALVNFGFLGGITKPSGIAFFGLSPFLPVPSFAAADGGGGCSDMMLLMYDDEYMLGSRTRNDHKSE